MSEALDQCEAALTSGDVAGVPDSALEPADQSFADPQFTEIRSMLSPEPEPEPEVKSQVRTGAGARGEVIGENRSRSRRQR